MLKRIIDMIPKTLLGPLAVIAGIIYFYIQDPPKTVCDAQFANFRKQTQKHLYGTSKNSIVVPALFIKEVENCRNSNSVGGCYDWSEGLKKTIIASRKIPQECSPRLKELEPLISYYSGSLRVYAHISWNNTEIVRSRLYHWLDNEDLIVFCRLKAEYSRLKGVPTYKALESALFNELVSLKKLPKEEVWRRTILSHDCGEI
ncbi:MAG: hypothetical protein IT287_01095 [Bdellovibrionaceae bacterium]|nr:hypothetical protein [Pseudobdellovibrionaceae bacterium]